MVEVLLRICYRHISEKISSQKEKIQLILYEIRGLEVVEDKIGHQLVEMLAGIASIDAVIFVWICHKLKFFIVLNKRFGEFHCILEVNIVICGAVNH